MAVTLTELTELAADLVTKNSRFRNRRGTSRRSPMGGRLPPTPPGSFGSPFEAPARPGGVDTAIVHTPQDALYPHPAARLLRPAARKLV